MAHDLTIGTAVSGPLAASEEPAPYRGFGTSDVSGGQLEFADFRPDAIRWRRGAWATTTAALAIAAVFVVDVHSLWAGVAALVAGLVFFDAPVSQRLWFVVVLTVVGAGVVGSAIGFSGAWWADAIVLALLTVVITTFQSLGGPFLAAGFFVGFVALNATVAAEGDAFNPVAATVAYLIGGAVAMLAISLLHLAGRDPDEDTPIVGAITPLVGDEIEDRQSDKLAGVGGKLAARLSPKSRAFVFSVIRGIAVGIAVALGQGWFDDSWLWLALPTFMLIVPAWDVAWASASKRLAGNLIGVGVFAGDAGL